MVSAANVPALAGTSRGNTTRRAKRHAERVTDSGQLTLPSTWSDVPAKSIRSASPSTLTATSIGMSSSTTPSPSISPLARYSPSGMRAIASRVRRSV